MTIGIRDIRIDEAEKFSTLLREVFMATYAHCSSAENVAMFVEQQYSSSAQCAELDDPALRSLVIVKDGEWAGVAQLRLTAAGPEGEPACGFVSRFFFRAPFHGLGLAQQLLGELIRIARAADMEVLRLSSWKNAPQALRFYEKAGFQKLAPADFVVGDDVLEDWLMQLRL